MSECGSQVSQVSPIFREHGRKGMTQIMDTQTRQSERSRGKFQHPTEARRHGARSNTSGYKRGVFIVTECTGCNFLPQ